MRRSRTATAVSATLLSLPLVVGAPQPAVAGPTVTVLPKLGGHSSFASAVNAAGTIVGSAELSTGRWHAVVWTNGTIRDLGTLGGENSQAEDIDENGWMVGMAQSADRRTHAVVWIEGRIHDLGVSSATGSWAAAISNGYVAARWQATDEVFAGRRASLVSGKPGALTRTYVPATPGASADAVNSSGTVAGTNRYVEYGDPAFDNHRAFTWRRGGTVRELGTLGGPGSNAFDINDAGHVVGNSSTASGVPKGFFWDGTRMRALPSPSTDTPTAQAVNDADVVVGTFGTSGHAVVWDSPTSWPRRLSEPSGSTGSSAVDLNRNGVVVGNVDYSSPQFSTRAAVWR